MVSIGRGRRLDKNKKKVNFCDDDYALVMHTARIDNIQSRKGQTALSQAHWRTSTHLTIYNNSSSCAVQRAPPTWHRSRCPASPASLSISNLELNKTLSTVNPCSFRDDAFKYPPVHFDEEIRSMLQFAALFRQADSLACDSRSRRHAFKSSTLKLELRHTDIISPMGITNVYSYSSPFSPHMRNNASVDNLQKIPSADCLPFIRGRGRAFINN